MPERVEVVVVGGGQAGLAVSRELTERRVDHVVLERGRVGQTWRDRWESFCLVTPNWTVRLPGGEYAGGDPDGYLARDALVAHLEAYARSFGAPIRDGVSVRAVAARPDRGFALTTSAGIIHTDVVVLCTGAYQRPHRPVGALQLPVGLPVIDAESYRSPAAVPPGAVLVVGSGQTGCQLADELRRAGREVYLACGRAPWGPRRFGGRDIVSWLVDAGYLEVATAALAGPSARLTANIQATGHDGGYDLHYRVLQRSGVTLLGRLVGAAGGRARFAPDLAESVAFGDARYRDLRSLIRQHCARAGIAAPELPDPTPFEASAPDSVDLRRLGMVIFTSGFRPDYSSWVHLDAFDEMGFPIHRDGASVVDGLYFCGTHFLRKRKSSLLIGVGEDAAIVADRIAATRRRAPGAGLPAQRPVDASPEPTGA